jgi:CheY-like chemotaxis protein
MRNVQILLADDDEDDRFFFLEALTDAAIPAELLTVEDGIQLMDYLSGIENPPPPDIIFLDINMPLKNGKTCLREIRDNQKFNEVPIVMFTTSSHQKDIDDTFTGGANRYILKSEFFEHEVQMLQKLFSPGWAKHIAKPSKENFILRLAD